jgi:hypothetical protein
MLKISRIGLCEYNKSCISFHNESNKIEFAFFWIFYDFLRILQVSAIHNHYLEIHFAPGALEIFKTLHPCPCCALKSQQRNGVMQLGPRPWGRHGSADSGETGGTPGRARERGGVYAHPGASDARNLGGEALYDGAGDRRGWPRRPRFWRDRRTEWTTRDARGTRGSMDGAQMSRWLGTSWTIARRWRRSWWVVWRGWAARPSAHRGGQPP